MSVKRIVKSNRVYFEEDYKHRQNGIRRIRTLGKAMFAPGILPGYPGLTFLAHKIGEYIPKCNIFLEPFAGLGRIAKKVQAKHKILNDLSPFAFSYLKRNFPNAKVTNLDFVDSIKQNRADVIFCDPPWRYEMYATNKAPVCDRPIKQYYEDLMNVLENTDSHWIISADYHEKENNKFLQKSGFPMLTLKSRRKMMAGYPRVRMISNKPFILYHQETLN